MKINFLKNGFLALASVVTLASCGPVDKNIVVNNTFPLTLHQKTLLQYSEDGGLKKIEEHAKVFWDVQVSINGIDYGVIEGGKKSSVKLIKNAGKLKADVLKIVKNDKGQSFYTYNADSTKKYFHWDDEDVMKWKDFKNADRDIVKLLTDLKKIELEGGVMNDFYTFNVSYGTHGNIAAKLAAEKAKKEAAAREAKEQAERDKARMEARAKEDSIKKAGGSVTPKADKNSSSSKNDKKKKK